jgi:D-alanyl-D-alanine-carboxypeptidase/D-alanyl-D-alanine-endopeptidase
MRTFRREWIPVLALCLLTACGGGGGGDGGDIAPAPPTGFERVDNALRAAYQADGIPMGLVVYDDTGTKVFEGMYGGFTADRFVAIASASKLVSGVTLFRLIDAGFLSLDSTTAQVLGWTGEKGTITLRHLLSFTSGLAPEHLCTYQPNISLADCVEQIRQADMVGAPGTRFDYGSTHLHVAARMAEVATGSSWNQIFDIQLRQPLGLSSQFAFYARPRQGDDPDPINPLPAGGMRASMNEYARVLRFVFDKGRWQGAQIMLPGIFDLQTVTPYPDAVVMTTPAANPNVRYGLTAWLECDTPQTGCQVISSPGVFGFTPWLDRETGYYAILGMELSELAADQGYGPRLQQQLKPLIIEALR